VFVSGALCRVRYGHRRGGAGQRIGDAGEDPGRRSIGLRATPPSAWNDPAWPMSLMSGTGKAGRAGHRPTGPLTGVVRPTECRRIIARSTVGDRRDGLRRTRAPNRRAEICWNDPLRSQRAAGSRRRTRTAARGWQERLIRHNAFGENCIESAIRTRSGRTNTPRNKSLAARCRLATATCGGLRTESRPGPLEFRSRPADASPRSTTG
jgi:hypothetical protein